MSDRLAWLEQWCPECHAAPGARCTRWRSGRGGRSRAVVVPHIHVARGWFERSCPTCKAAAGEPLRDADGPEGLARPRGPTAARPLRAGLASGGLGRAQPPGCDRRHRSVLGPCWRRWAHGHDPAAQARRRQVGRDRAVDVSRRALSRARSARLGSLRDLRRASARRRRGHLVERGQVRPHPRQAWRAHVRGARRVNGPCSPRDRLTVPRQTGLARGPPAADVLGNEKDRVAARSSRT